MNKPDASATAHAGVVVVTHVDYGASLLRAAESILGPLQDCSSIQVDAAVDSAETVKRLQDAAMLLDHGQGVIILTDMFGGTPTNLSLSLLNTHAVEVVTGVNLPMLLKVFENRIKLGLRELAMLAMDAGCKGIVSAGDMLRKKAQAD